MHLVPLQLLTSGLFLTFTILHNMGIKSEAQLHQGREQQPKIAFVSSPTTSSWEVNKLAHGAEFLPVPLAVQEASVLSFLWVQRAQSSEGKGEEILKSALYTELKKRGFFLLLQVQNFSVSDG